MPVPDGSEMTRRRFLRVSAAVCAAVFDFALSEEEMARLSALDTDRRYENW